MMAAPALYEQSERYTLIVGVIFSVNDIIKSKAVRYALAICALGGGN